MKKFEIFTDGSCLNNPGPGGYGIILKYNNNYIKFSQGYYLTTNNRMELMGTIKILKYLYNSNIIIYTDSLYLKNGITIWINKWINKSWKNKKNKKIIKNFDLWIKLYDLSKKHYINWKWIKGHSDNLYNNMCDYLAKKSASNPKKIDFGYLLKINF